ncbi:hypothetical protein [Micromonospora sp. DT41]|uniref:hypothetical protein n=1 Tax=Micromonospora sp. DT41 TaxID=3393437 RepID=UPI003CE9CA26
MTVKTYKTVAPDGRRVSFACRVNGLRDDWFWQMRLTSKTVSVGVTIGRPGYVDKNLESQKLQVVDRITYKSSTLLRAVNAERDGWFIGWKGPHHDLMFGGANSGPDMTAVVALLDLIDIADAPAGLVLRPLAGSGVVLWNMAGTTDISGAGPVTFYPLTEAGALVPDGNGLRVGTGHVWKKSLDVNGAQRGETFVHVNNSAVALIPDDRSRDERVTEAALEDLLDSLDIQWSN